MSKRKWNCDILIMNYL